MPGLIIELEVFKIAAAKALYREFDRGSIRKHIYLLFFEISVENRIFKVVSGSGSGLKSLMEPIGFIST